MYSTRFQGSKRRVLPWLLPLLEKEMRGGLFLDGFSGSGLVAWGMADRGWRVAGVDRLRSSGTTLRAFIGNKATLSPEEAIEGIRPSSKRDPLFRTYQGIFYPDDELRWLLGAAERGRTLRGGRRDIFFWALLQASLAKRPYNLFHRANLDMRLRKVDRSFGNARTWERPFPEMLRRFVEEQSREVLRGAEPAQFIHGDLSRVRLPEADLIYLDPPYIPLQGESIDYLDFYGFGELLLRPTLPLDSSKAHRPLRHQKTSWEKRDRFLYTLENFSRHNPRPALALSYRSDGYPSPDELLAALGEGTRIYTQPIKYALSHKTSEEILLLRPGAENRPGAKT